MSTFSVTVPLAVSKRPTSALPRVVYVSEPSPLRVADPYVNVRTLCASVFAAIHH